MVIFISYKISRIFQQSAKKSKLGVTGFPLVTRLKLVVSNQNGQELEVYLLGTSYTRQIDEVSHVTRILSKYNDTYSHEVS